MAAGKGRSDPQDRQIEGLKQELSQRDQVIGELTIANRILRRTAAGLR